MDCGQTMTDTRRERRQQAKTSTDLLHEHLLSSYTANADYNDGNEKSADGDEEPDGQFALGLSYNVARQWAPCRMPLNLR